MTRIKFTGMMNNKTYFTNIEDDYIQSLPSMTFPGKISLIDYSDDLEKIKFILLHEKILGFDTETKPSFKKGRSYQVALLQLSTAEHAFLFRLNKITMPAFLVDLFENKHIIKVGVAIKDDIHALNRLKPFVPEGFVDLQPYVKKFGIEDNGLKKLVANVLGYKISKKWQTSNWESETLSNEQLGYAATDAWVCRQMYEVLSNHNLPLT